MDKKITIISFSGRNNGNCMGIAAFIEHFYIRTNVSTYIIEGKSFASCGGCDYECLKQDVKCPKLTHEQKAIMDAICDSDLVYFIVPNYCGYPCSNYFAFNERSVGYFNLNRELMNRYMSVPKKFIIVSNTEGDNFVNAMRQQTDGEPDILYLKSGKYKKRSTAGDILESEDARADLKAFLDAEHP